jgi:SAM-dependent methyltransferase
VSDVGIENCLRGEAVFGDDLEGEDLEKWFEAEKEGYARLYEVGGKGYKYPYASLDKKHLLARLDAKRRFKSACALGAAQGDELLPLLERVGEIVLVEPSEKAGSALPEEKRRVIKPRADGWIDLPNESQDLVLCLSVLHHIPKFSRTLAEIGRIAAPGAQLLLREPLISMGDWRRPRPGLTPNERGLPAKILRRTIEDSGFSVESWIPFGFPLTKRLGQVLGLSAYNVPAFVRLDEILCRWSYPRLRYHATTPWQKIQPSAVCLAARKI